MAELEGRGEIKLGRLLLDRLDDGLAAMAGIGAPQAGGRIEHRPAGHVVIVHVLGAGDEPRPLLERAIGCKAHPEGFEIVGRRFPLGCVRVLLRLVHGMLLWRLTPGNLADLRAALKPPGRNIARCQNVSQDGTF